MKLKLSIALMVSATLTVLFGPVGLLALLIVLLNSNPAQAILGTSYPEIATTTLAGYVSGNAQVQQQLWIDRVLDTNGALYQSTPFADGMTGRVKVGKPADDRAMRKAVVEITDTSKVRGDTINIFSEAGIGGEGATGDNVRNGTEAQIVTGNMTVKIGNQLFSLGFKQSSVDKTMIGLGLLQNKKWNDDLRSLHAKRKNDTIIWRMLATAGYGTATFNAVAGSSPNLILPPGIANRDLLKSANTVDLPTIMQAGDVLPGLGAYPMDTTDDSGGSVGELFMFFAADKSLFDLESDPTNNSFLQYGWDRGPTNPIFKGGFVKVRGHGLYRWIHRDHANYDNIGSPLVPRAKLAVATTNTDAQDLRGGGTLTGASTDTVPQWFKHFSNAPVSMYGGINNIAATTSATRYVMIIGSGGYSVWSYTVNNGNKITTTAKVAGSTATTPYVHSVGDLIVECNALNTVIARSIMFGAQAVVGGVGSINGSVASPEMGRIVRQELDLQNDISLGVEGVAGYSSVTRAGDNLAPGFVVCEHALSPTAVPGAPTIS